MSDDKNPLDEHPKNEECASPERQVKRARTDASSPIEINTKSADDSNRPLPGFVAGASPAKFITVGQLKEINDELSNMAIAHEISLNPDFKVEDLKEKNTSELTKKVEEIATKAFYDSIREKLQESPPNYEPLFNLYAELKPLAIEVVTPQISKIFDQMDVEEPRRQHQLNCLDMRALLLDFLNLLAQVCAPIRDDEISSLRDEKDVVNLFKGLHQLLKVMKHDMINFTIKQSRHQFLQHSAKFESEKFMKVLELYPSAADETQAWLNEALTEYLNGKEPQPKEIAESDLPTIMSIAYARLLEGKRNDITFPETLKYDMGRVSLLVDERLRLAITLCAVFISSNLAGKEICEKTDFKKTLKTNLLAILQDINRINCESFIENVYLEANKQLEAALKTSWNSNYSSLLRSQIETAIKNSDNSIRKVVDERIFIIVSTVLRGPQSMAEQGTQLPPGLSLIEPELVSLISRYLSVTIHNIQSFGAFYLQRLNRQLQIRITGQGNSSTAL
ncbi:hypothetical protein M3Y97_00198200 [Aphelenchoides bicaudatus]|nr:hypothetical protein M3Y97_00198200 [Aphelenchoides bicaudatus]